MRELLDISYKKTETILKSSSPGTPGATLSHNMLDMSMMSMMSYSSIEDDCDVDTGWTTASLQECDTTDTVSTQPVQPGGPVGRPENTNLGGDTRDVKPGLQPEFSTEEIWTQWRA